LKRLGLVFKEKAGNKFKYACNNIIKQTMTKIWNFKDVLLSILKTMVRKLGKQILVYNRKLAQNNII